MERNLTMAFDTHSLFGYSTIKTIVSQTVNTLIVIVQSNDGARFSLNQQVILWPAGTGLTLLSNAMVGRVTAISGDQITIDITSGNREGSLQYTVQVGWQIANGITPKVLKDIEALLSGKSQGAIFYADSNGIITTLNPGTAGQVLQSNGAAANPSFVTPATTQTDGWITTTDTFVFVTSNSFKIVGVDRTGVYVTGTRVKFINNGITVYGVVVSSSFGSDTLVTLAANDDYSIANLAITFPFYSYAICPVGYPTFFNYTPTLTGGTSPSIVGARFKLDGKACTVIWQQCSISSNSGSFSITLPITPTVVVATGGLDVYPVMVEDNSAWLNGMGVIGITANVQAALIGITLSTQSGNTFGGFTASGIKNISGEFIYPIS